MSKRLWTETRQVGAKNSIQKLSKTKAKLSQAEPSWAKLSQAEPSWVELKSTNRQKAE